MSLTTIRERTMKKGMTNAQTKAHLLEWVKLPHSTFSWPTDACGYDQHIKFVKHRNKNWNEDYQGDFIQFVRDYARSL